MFYFYRFILLLAVCICVSAWERAATCGVRKSVSGLELEMFVSHLNVGAGTMFRSLASALCSLKPRATSPVSYFLFLK